MDAMGQTCRAGGVKPRPYESPCTSLPVLFIAPATKLV